MQQQTKKQKPKNPPQKPKTKNYDVEISSICQDARDLDIIVFCFWFFGGFWFVVAYCTQLLSQAMYNLMMATTMAETCIC